MRTCRALGCATSDYYAVFAAFGHECVGAVRVADPEGFERSGCPDLCGTSLDLVDLARLLVEEAGAALDAYAMGIMHACVSGFQPKLCVALADTVVRGGHVSTSAVLLPDDAHPSTHILKPQPARWFRGLVRSEAWAMRVAGHAARCARTWLLDLDGAPQTLVVERFDRMREHGALKRVHQEDLCQALGLDPDDKYAHAHVRKGTDPTYAKAANLLVVYAEDPEAELKELLRQLVVTLAVGNTDAHGKNLSFIFETPGVPVLSPLYDVVPVVDVEPRADTLSMRVNGKVRLLDIAREDVVDEAVAWGLDRKTVFSVIDDALEGLRQVLCEAGEHYPEAASRHEALTLERMGRLCVR